MQCKLRQTCIFNDITANRDLSIIKLYSLLATPHPQTKLRVDLCKYNLGYTHTCQMRKKVKKEKGKVQRMTKTETNEREKGRTTCKKDQR